MCLLVQRHSHRVPSGRNGPASEYFLLRQINLRDDILVFKIDINLPNAIGSKKLGCAAQFGRRVDLATLGIDVSLEAHQHSLVARDGEDAVQSSVLDDASRGRVCSEASMACGRSRVG